MMASETGSKKARKRWRDRGPLDRLTIIFRAVAFTVVAIFAASIVWAGIYRFAEPPGTPLMLSRQLSGVRIDKAWTPLDDISPNLVRAVIAAEDTRFCIHKGFDFDAIDEAFSAAGNGQRLRGASTISQQTAKNAFLWSGRSWLRKGAEAWMTMVIEILWPKRRILEVYLNIAEWGDGVFGAEAAAQKRFGKSAARLNEREAALLAAVLPNPHKWRVDPPGPYVLQRTEILRRRMNTVTRDGLDACVSKR